MKDAMTCVGYAASMVFDAEDKVIVGRVQDVDDIITFTVTAFYPTAPLLMASTIASSSMPSTSCSTSNECSPRQGAGAMGPLS
jgi:hypothetical protein